MLSQFAAAFRTPDLRNKDPVHAGPHRDLPRRRHHSHPGVDYTAIQTCLTLVEGNSLYGLISLFSGGALLQLSVFAGHHAVHHGKHHHPAVDGGHPATGALRKEAGPARRDDAVHRYLTIGLSVLQATAFISLARSPGQLFQGCNENLIPNQSIR